MKVDYLIIGQGLAGSAMAMALLEQGASVHVLDREDANSASRVAAGLVTTVAGKGMNVSWRQAEYLPEAIAYYRDLELRSGKTLFHEMELLRMFDDEKQSRKFTNKKDSLISWVADAQSDDLNQWNSEYGGFVMLHGGWLDTNAYLEAVRMVLGDSYEQRNFIEGDLSQAIEGIKYQEIEAKSVILCQGAAGLTGEGRLFSHIQHRCAKGEMLRVKIPNKAQHQIVNRNSWLVPLGNEEWRAGATYEWEDMEGSLTDEGRADVERRIRVLTDTPFQVLEHTAGVRPIIRKSQPYIGTHPEYINVKFFNGLGSKGVTTAPSVARHFADHLVNGTVLDPDLELK